MRHGTRRKKQRKRQNGKHCIDWASYIVFLFFRFGCEMLLLIEFLCWIGLDLIRFCFGFFGFSAKTFFCQIYKHAKTLYCFLFFETSNRWVSPVEPSRILLWPLFKNRLLYSLSLMFSFQIIISGSYKNKTVGSIIVFSIVWRGLQKSIGIGEMERHLKLAPLSNSNHQKICIPQLAVHYYRVSFLFLLYLFFSVFFLIYKFLKEKTKILW